MTDPAIVVTGAGGLLGREVVRALHDRGMATRGLGRGAAATGFPAPWTSVDLLQADSVRAALTGGEVVIHAASAPFDAGADVAVARIFARVAEEARVARIIFVQIAGIARATRASTYYRDKISAEAILRRGSTPVSVAYATQFHPLIDRVFTALSYGPVLLRPHFTLQPVDVGFFADKLAQMALAPDMASISVCGPQKLSAREMSRSWLASRKRRALTVPMPSVGLLAGFARIEPVAGEAGGVSWAEWLTRDRAETIHG